ncbi:MAG: cyclic nucleotide-binding domain-containing protein [Anaerolineaceae bacterium]|nr:cyclic nucleotide-binding domain-containing protein [Anaerolineaceae bacterium]
MPFRDIPARELEAFRDYMRVYRKDTVILKENEIDEDGLFLLRTGRVKVFKENHFMADIEALNFFGEMAIVNGGPRSATIVTSSPTAVVYHFQKPDLQIILSEPSWGILLFRRFSQNLSNLNEELVQLRNDNEQLSSRNESLLNHTVKIFSLLTEVQQDIALDVVVTAREWQYLNALAEVTNELLRTRLPEVANKIDFIDDDFWKQLKNDDILPDYLRDFIQKARKKRQTGS